MKHWILVAVVWLGLGLSQGMQLFVSPEGHDTHGDGSEERPFLSIQAAIDTAWDYDVIVLMDGVHSSDTEIRFDRKKLAVRTLSPPVVREGGCWPIHSGDTAKPTLTRCNVSSWPQSWTVPDTSDDVAWETLAESVQTWPQSFVDTNNFWSGYMSPAEYGFFHGLTRSGSPTSEGGDFRDPGDAIRGDPHDFTCGPLGCNPGFHGSGDLQSGIVSNTSIVGAKFVFLDGDEVILRDLHIRGSSSNEPHEEEGGCFFAAGDCNITVVDSVFQRCTARQGGGAVSLGFGSNVWFHGVRFLNNSASFGGGVLVSMEADIRFDRCEFSGNEGDQGGAVYVGDRAMPRFDECDFFANQATKGGVMMSVAESIPMINNSAFWHNTALEGGVIAAAERARPAFANCTFQNNSATLLGGVMYSEERTRISSFSSAFYFNHAIQGGGAVYSFNAMGVALTACDFGYNTATKGQQQVHPVELSVSSFFPYMKNNESLKNNTVCSGNGQSADGLSWKCDCNPGYGGAECRITCPGFNSTSNYVCSGHGRCSIDSSKMDRECRMYGGRRWFCLDVGEAHCTCNFGYVGHNCSQICPGYTPPKGRMTMSRGVCSGHGNCVVFNGTAGCDCEFGWGGTDCSEIRLYAIGVGGHSSQNRVVRLGDKVLVNNRERGLHLLVLNRTDLTVVWDKNYEVMAFFGDDGFYEIGDNDGTVNVAEGVAKDGSEGSLNASTAGVLTRNPQDSELFFREDEANRLARDLSLFDAHHLVVLTSFFAWENQTNLAVVQAIQRCGGPDLSPYINNKMGQGHSFALAGVPDGEQLFSNYSASYILGHLASSDFGNFSAAELEVNLKQGSELQYFSWCGARVLEHGVDVSAFVGTSCVPSDAVFPVPPKDESGGLLHIPGCLASTICNGTKECNGTLVCNGTIVDYVDTRNGTNKTGQYCKGIEWCNGTEWCRGQLVCDGEIYSGPPTATRWLHVNRTTQEGHHPGGQQLESWDLSSDFDPSVGPTPVLQSRDIAQPCCNRSTRWEHGGCRKGRSVASHPEFPERLICEESGWNAGAGRGLFGNIDVEGSYTNTLNVHTPARDSMPLSQRFGMYTPYNPRRAYEGSQQDRSTPFSAQDIDVQLKDADASYGQDYYAQSRGIPTPTPMFKACEPGRNECQESYDQGLSVRSECARGQCQDSTGFVEQQRWQQDP